MGLDLESVRHILNLESPPQIPASAMKDLQAGPRGGPKGDGDQVPNALLRAAGLRRELHPEVLADKVCLENAITVTGTTITGVVRVANISFHKNVRIRFTTKRNSNDGPTDRFSFSLVPPADFVPGSKIEFAVSFNANGAEYWDNNRGANYVFECYAKTIPTEAENSWIHFL
nr:hypothetical protein BaRGS_003804 [Batillaria attramentaria]